VIIWEPTALLNPTFQERRLRLRVMEKNHRIP